MTAEQILNRKIEDFEADNTISVYPSIKPFIIQCMEEYRASGSKGWTDEIQEKIIEWYKQNHYSQGDSYSVRVTNKGKWAVSYSNDSPMQHGSGQEHVLLEDDFIEAMSIKLPQP